MPTLQRKSLRRAVGQRRLRETTLGTTHFSPAGAAGSAFIVMDRALARPDFSGDSQYNRAWVRVGSADYQVASFNFGSGAAFANQPLTAAVQSGMDFEIHEKLAPTEIDQAVDETILSLRVKREVGLPTIDGAMFYPLDGAASPNTIMSYEAAGYFANPNSSVNRDFRRFAQNEIVTTASGIELRIAGGLAASQQVVITALLQLSLGSGDSATMSVPWDEETITWGAAARCYDLLIQRSPGQEATLLERRRKEAANTFSVRSRRIMPEISRPLGFVPFERPALSDGNLG